MKAYKLIPCAAILLAGCAGFTLKAVSADLKDAYTVGNVTWQDLGQNKTQAQLVLDYVAGGVSQKNAEFYAKIVAGGKEVVTITKEIASFIDSLNKAAA